MVGNPNDSRVKMSAKEDQLRESGELLDDIRYVNQVSEQEVQRLRERLRRRVSAAGLHQDATGPLLDEVSAQLGLLSAKVKLTNQAVRSLQKEIDRPGRSKDIVADTGKMKPPPYLTFGAAQLVENKNLLPMESVDGIDYCWSGADPEIRFSFPLDRSEKLGMQIRLLALIKPEYLRKMKIMIDGEHAKHRFAVDGRLYVVNCVLPSDQKGTPTDIAVLLPGTHRPADLGSSQDGRLLGVAISEIRFGDPESWLSNMLKRLKFKN